MNGRIKITRDEAFNSAIQQSSYTSETKNTPEKKNLFKKIAIGVALLVCAITGAILLSEKNQSVESFQSHIIETINRELANPNHTLRVFVQNQHGTVTVKQAYVSDCTVKTTDYNKSIKPDCSNIQSISYTINFIWDGIFHKNGKTIIRITEDHKTGATQSEIVHTDALISDMDAFLEPFMEELINVLLFCL